MAGTKQFGKSISGEAHWQTGDKGEGVTRWE